MERGNGERIAVLRKKTYASTLTIEPSHSTHCQRQWFLNLIQIGCPGFWTGAPAYENPLFAFIPALEPNPIRSSPSICAQNSGMEKVAFYAASWEAGGNEIHKDIRRKKPGTPACAWGFRINS
jgi:hypothetical protein